VQDLILSCVSGRVSSEAVQRGIRALCRHYGGLLLYVPARKEDGIAADKLRGVLADAVGDGPAEEMLERIMRLYGGIQIYLPLERNAFRKTIALEIFARLGTDGLTMTDLAREYGITFSHAYTLWREGRAEKLRPSMPYLPFLELAEDNNHG